MKNRKKTLFVLLILVAIGLAYVAFLQFKISQYSQKKIEKNADYMIILGAKVNGRTPSLALKYRINAAFRYLEKNKSTIVIASGGQGLGEDITEAAAIKNELIKKGIDQAQIILETHSTSTYENIKFSKPLIPKGAKYGIIVTNHFHLYRSMMVAKDQGLHVTYISAKTPVVAIPKSYTREYLAITKYYLDRLLLY